MPAYKPEQCDELLIEAINRGDLEACVALYEPNASFVLDSGEIVTGRAAIREVAQSYLTLKLQMLRASVELRPACPIAATAADSRLPLPLPFEGRGLLSAASSLLR